MNKVILEKVTDSCNKVSLLKIIREIKNLDLESAKNIIDSAPSVLFEDISKKDALLVKKIIENAGANVTLFGIELAQEDGIEIENTEKNSEEKIENKKSCPCCGEKILSTAKKCKHCGEWFERENSIKNNNKNENLESLFKYGPCKTVMSIINFAILIFAFVDNSFGDFFWSNFWAFCIWAAISSAVANAIDEDISKKNKE